MDDFSPMMFWNHWVIFHEDARSYCGDFSLSRSFRWEWSESRDINASFSGSRYRSGGGEYCASNMFAQIVFDWFNRHSPPPTFSEMSYVTSPADPIRGITENVVYYDDIQPLVVLPEE